MQRLIDSSWVTCLIGLIIRGHSIESGSTAVQSDWSGFSLSVYILWYRLNNCREANCATLLRIIPVFGSCLSMLVCHCHAESIVHEFFALFGRCNAGYFIGSLYVCVIRYRAHSCIFSESVLRLQVPRIWLSPSWATSLTLLTLCASACGYIRFKQPCVLSLRLLVRLAREIWKSWWDRVKCKSFNAELLGKNLMFSLLRGFSADLDLCDLIPSLNFGVSILGAIRSVPSISLIL